MKFTLWFTVSALVLALSGCHFFGGQQPLNILVFSKTAGFRHESIEAGIAALQKMADERAFNVTFTEDAALFQTANLSTYNAVVFLNTTGDVLDKAQEEAFERYIQAGGGYVGIHAATDTEYDWPWYGQLAGAYFLDHPNDPNVREATMEVAKKDHWATQGMPDRFQKTDEFYNFQSISSHINVVLTIDESNYEGGKNGDDHPMSWYHEFDGGRAFYTAMGHTNETFSEPLFLGHLWAGIHYAAGGDDPQPLDYTKARPEENRFSKVMLTDKLDEPMELTLLDDQRILFIERKGAVKLFNTATNTVKTIANIPVSTKYVNKEGKESEAEDGLMGLNKDPDFANNHWIYLYYSTPNRSSNLLSRFELRGDSLLMASEKVLLEVPVQREECCHAGGSIDWDAAGNLYLSTGDNTNPHASNGYSPSDERPGRSPWDAQKSSANTNDLRGKIIRIKPQPDGTYTVPEGNLFAKGTAQTRPEIYTMGHRNPFRISIDQRTGFLYWGDVGPDASAPDSTRGPAGHDEVGQARKAGNFGWPHFVGDNKAYYKYDFAKEQSIAPWDAAAPMNTSPNNTGLTKLPPAQKAFVWYPYAKSDVFPLTGDGGRNAMAGPVFYAYDFKGAERAFPAYYDGKLFMYDWMRGWIMAVTMDDEGNLTNMERFMPSHKFSNPMDMAFAANGDLYMLEYGTGWFSQNDDARLVRIEYNGGNRKPEVQMTPEKLGGSVPFTLRVSADGTSDPDGDKLQYRWEITSDNGFEQVMTTPNLALEVKEAGIYRVTLLVDDGAGGKANQSVEIMAGNEIPVVAWDIPNRSFYTAGQPIQYAVLVSDKEDGALNSGISPDRVALTIDYLPEGFDKIAIAQGHRSADASALFARGKKLMADSDCAACHKQQEKSIGPSYKDIAVRYKGDKTARAVLAERVIKGTSGAWGETAMAAHPQLSPEDASEMIGYILSLVDERPKSTLPIKGSYAVKLPPNDAGIGQYVLRAAYEDNGTASLPSLTGESTLVLRNAMLNAHSFDEMEGCTKMEFSGYRFAIAQKMNGWAKLNQVDLRNVQSVTAHISTSSYTSSTKGSFIELRLGSPTGTLVGSSTPLEVSTTEQPTPHALRIPVAAKDLDTSKLHDLYFVFTHPDKATTEVNMVLNAVQFQF